MRYLEAPLMAGIIFYFIYMIFELFVRKQERMVLIEKMGQNLPPIDPSVLENRINTLLPSFRRKKSFSALRGGCLFVGCGLGLLTGLFVCMFLAANNFNWDPSLFFVAFVAPVLLFGGFGLIISYLIESKLAKEDKQ